MNIDFRKYLIIVSVAMFTLSAHANIVGICCETYKVKACKNQGGTLLSNCKCKPKDDCPAPRYTLVDGVCCQSGSSLDISGNPNEICCRKVGGVVLEDTDSDSSDNGSGDGSYPSTFQTYETTVLTKKIICCMSDTSPYTWDNRKEVNEKCCQNAEGAYIAKNGDNPAVCCKGETEGGKKSPYTVDNETEINEVCCTTNAKGVYKKSGTNAACCVSDDSSYTVDNPNVSNKICCENAEGVYKKSKTDAACCVDESPLYRSIDDKNSNEICCSANGKDYKYLSESSVCCKGVSSAPHPDTVNEHCCVSEGGEYFNNRCCNPKKPGYIIAPPILGTGTGGGTGESTPADPGNDPSGDLPGEMCSDCCSKFGGKIEKYGEQWECCKPASSKNVLGKLDSVCCGAAGGNIKGEGENKKCCARTNSQQS